VLKTGLFMEILNNGFEQRLWTAVWNSRGWGERWLRPWHDTAQGSRNFGNWGGNSVPSAKYRGRPPWTG